MIIVPYRTCTPLNVVYRVYISDDAKMFK